MFKKIIQKLSHLFNVYQSQKKTKPFELISEVSGNQSSLQVQVLLETNRSLILNLSKKQQAKFILNDENELLVTIQGVTIKIECEEDLFIVNEIFQEMVYGIQLTGNVILIDVGLNIGIASLYFNLIPQVEKIYAFEPVEETYKKCLANLALNGTTPKIKTFNYGLGNTDRVDTFDYSKSFKGSVGKFDLPLQKQENLQFVQVQIKEAGQIISSILKENPNKKVMIKMDCEGSEEEIIPHLKTTGILDQIDLLILEWHDLKFLNELSAFDNFNCFYHMNSDSTGMLYAANKRIPK